MASFNGTTRQQIHQFFTKVLQSFCFSGQAIIDGKPVLHGSVWQPSVGGAAWAAAPGSQGCLASAAEEEPVQPVEPAGGPGRDQGGAGDRQGPRRHPAGHGRWVECGECGIWYTAQPVCLSLRNWSNRLFKMLSSQRCLPSSLHHSLSLHYWMLCYLTQRTIKW